MNKTPQDKKFYEHKEVWLIGFFLFTIYIQDFFEKTNESLSPEEVKNKALLTQIQITVENNAKQIQKLNDKTDKRYTSEDASKDRKDQEKKWVKLSNQLDEIEQFIDEHDDFKRDTERELNQIKKQLNSIDP